MTEEPILERLFRVVASRQGASLERSYTAKLFQRGRLKIAQKVGEEATETVIAAVAQDKAAIASESADLIYHLMVLWADCGLEPKDIWAELERREGISGLEEKSSRTP